MKALMAIMWGAVGALVVMAGIVVIVGPWWLPGAPASIRPDRVNTPVDKLFHPHQALPMEEDIRVFQACSL